VQFWTGTEEEKYKNNIKLHLIELPMTFWKNLQANHSLGSEGLLIGAIEKDTKMDCWFASKNVFKRPPSSP